MAKNYRRLHRTLHEWTCCLDARSNRERRKVNRNRYRAHADYRQMKEDKPHMARWSGLNGQSLKLVSSRRFIDFHQRNFY